MDAWYEIISVILVSALKFFAGPILAKSFGFTYLQTILISSVGGCLGILFFFKLGARIVHFFPNYFKPVNKKKKIFHLHHHQKKKSQKFNHPNSI